MKPFEVNALIEEHQQATAQPDGTLRYGHDAEPRKECPICEIAPRERAIIARDGSETAPDAH